MAEHFKDAHDSTLLNKKQVTEFLGFERNYFNNNLAKNPEFCEMVPPIRMYDRGLPRFRLGDLKKFVAKQGNA